MKLKILITGATGFVGKQLCKALALEGHECVVLTRNAQSARFSIPAPHTTIQWDFSSELDSSSREHLKGLDAIVHLAGESIAGKRWDPAFERGVEKVENTKYTAFNSAD